LWNPPAKVHGAEFHWAGIPRIQAQKSGKADIFEEPCSKLQGIFDRKDFSSIFRFARLPRSPAPAGRGMRSLLRFNALAGVPPHTLIYLTDSST